jgi:hypothetical protein
MHPWKFSNVSVSITSCDSAWIYSVMSKDTLSAIISSWGIGKSRRGRGQANGGGNHCNVFGSQELSKNEWCVSGLVVMVEKPIVFLPLVWTFAPNALPKTLQNLTVKLAIDSLTRGTNSLWTMPWMSKKRSTWTWDCCELDALFFGRGEFGDFRCDDCCLVSGS